MTKIMIVEDDDISRELMVLRLQLANMASVTAQDGREAITVAAQERPDLILLDMNIPVVDGWETASTLKGTPETSGIPIIGVSAHARQEDRNRALDAGCDEYESKPVEWEKLFPKIKMLLEQKS